jgi:hypothetical protein
MTTYVRHPADCPGCSGPAGADDDLCPIDYPTPGDRRSERDDDTDTPQTQ